jgi:hypothetical protein
MVKRRTRTDFEGDEPCRPHHAGNTNCQIPNGKTYINLALVKYKTKISEA